MFKITIRTLTAAVVIAAAGAPSAASGTVGTNPSPRAVAIGHTQSSIVPPVSFRSCHPRAGRCMSPTNTQVDTTSVGVCHRPAGRCMPPASVNADVDTALSTAAAAPEGFQWGDAGIGAAAMLLLLSAGGAATIAGRRRHHRATAS